MRVFDAYGSQFSLGAAKLRRERAVVHRVHFFSCSSVLLNQSNIFQMANDLLGVRFG
jgi:hypothetical protein